MSDMERMAGNGDLPLVTQNDRKIFERDGFFLLKSFLKEEGVKYYLTAIDDILGRPHGSHTLSSVQKSTHTMADGVTKNSQLWPLIFDEKLLETLRQLIGTNIRYTQHSDIHINLPGGRWHRDNAHRNFSRGPDWQENKETYGVLRVAIYLSDFSNTGSSLLLLPGSHRNETPLNRHEYVVWNKLRSMARKRQMNEAFPHLFLSRPYFRLKTRPGDCLIFDQRVMHAGGTLRGLFSKYAIYLSYGLDNSHSINHRDFFLSRPTYSKNIPGTLEKKLREADLLLTKYSS